MCPPTAVRAVRAVGSGFGEVRAVLGLGGSVGGWAAGCLGYCGLRGLSY